MTSRFKWTPEHQEIAEQMRAEGSTFTKIAERIGTTIVTVHRHLDEGYRQHRCRQVNANRRPRGQGLGGRS